MKQHLKHQINVDFSFAVNPDKTNRPILQQIIKYEQKISSKSKFYNYYRFPSN